MLVRFPFTDQSSSKKRPAVVVSSRVYNRERPDVVLMAVTGRDSSRLSEALDLILGDATTEAPPPEAPTP